jgi:branched-chain amino acid transport system ATP-binding protein
MATPGSKSALLRVEDLGVAFGALIALENVTWSVGAGEILGIIGPNGAGKSTCYNAVTNLVTRRGKVFIGEEDVTGVAPHRLAERGLRRAFQQNAFFDNLTVIDNMIAVMSHDCGTGLFDCVVRPFTERRRAAESRRKAGEILERMGVPAHFHGQYPTEIPYGTQRMLSIALAYGTGARVLLLDEPAAGLGGEDMHRLIDLMHALRQEGVALVVIEHHMDLIMTVTDRIVVLDQGRMLACGTPAEIQNDHAVLEAYLGRSE